MQLLKRPQVPSIQRARIFCVITIDINDGEAHQKEGGAEKFEFLCSADRKLG